MDVELLRKEVLELIQDKNKWLMKFDYRDLNKEQFVDQMQSKYQYLYTNSSTLFNRCLEGDLNIEQFNYMLKMLEKVNAGKDFQQVSQELGQKLVDIYVKPLVKDKEKI